jgi:hypothetical protein
MASRKRLLEEFEVPELFPLEQQEKRVLWKDVLKFLLIVSMIFIASTVVIALVFFPSAGLLPL